MYKDLISYKLAEDISKDELLNIAQKVFDEWMVFQEGFIKWEINQNPNGTFTDIVIWKNKESCFKAHQNMMSYKSLNEWIKCYNPSSISNSPVEEIKSFEK